MIMITFKTLSFNNYSQDFYDMPTYYDKKTKTWFCQFRYVDYTGKTKQKRKRGFTLQRDAKEWERSFLAQQHNDLSMPFEKFLELYQEDMYHRLKPKTKYVKKYIIEKHILPYFKDKEMNSITAMDIRKWQNTIMSKYDYSQAYLKKINGILNAIFNYASKYYDLKNNPCKKAECIGSHKSKEMQVYTLEEFNKLIQCFDDQTDVAIFTTLYYTGMRKGELFALTRKDIDLDKGIINIDKSYQRLQAKDVITSPKTPKSIRKIEIPKFLIQVLKDYIDTLYDVSDDTYIFMHHYVKLRDRLKKAQKKASLSEITVHSFRHCHASLLINMGYSPLLVADRLGDNVETVMKIYSHLYPTKKNELIQKLDNLTSDVKMMSTTPQEKKNP